MHESTNAIRRVSDIVSEYRKFVHGSRTLHPSVTIFSTSLLTRLGDRHDRGRSPPASQRDEGQIDFLVGQSAVQDAVSDNTGCDVKMDGKNTQLGADPASIVGFLSE